MLFRAGFDSRPRRHWPGAHGPASLLLIVPARRHPCGAQAVFFRPPGYMLGDRRSTGPDKPERGSNPQPSPTAKAVKK